MQLLDQDIQYLKGIGPARAKLLTAELGISTLGDLLHTYPYRYIDRSRFYRVCDLTPDMPHVQLKGQILDFETAGEGSRRRLSAIFSDGTGYLTLTWFNALKYVDKTYKVGRDYIIFGRPTFYNGRPQMVHPEIEQPEENATIPAVLRPMYHTTERMKARGLTSRTIAEALKQLFLLLPPELPETLPPHLLAAHGLLPLTEALRTIHFPAAATALPAARHRLKFEELFYLQLDIAHTVRQRRLNVGGYPFPHIADAFLRFYHQCLPFPLTDAQKRVVREIRADLGSGRQMNRLLQGDVGSGKTLVALLCALMAVDNGFQACLMAPTEILAEQHMHTLQNFLKDMPLRVELLTGSVRGRKRREVLDGVARGTVDILVGTHALVEPGVVFANLGLCIVDEQHRFGVRQRAALWQKNERPPHVLVMTATPIPRTLAMTVYGDLDVSVIDQLPPGRKPIHTQHFLNTAPDRARLYALIRRELAAGRQVYVVYPLIEENEKLDLQALERGYVELLGHFPEYKVGKVHGRMKSEEKETAMQAFSAGRTHLLVSTTVIEVGVNVPRASVMVIENAERFGLAQLHQLRGRVGRGADQSYCLLVTGREMSAATRRRIQIMTETTDGFVIAEEDLKLRGPGDLEGTAQSGLPFTLRIASLTQDAPLMAEARQAALDIAEADPDASMPCNALLWQRLRELKKWQQNFAAIS
ncbi:MAG: ATP-dependent DNA helicase RecG [Alloprevotella sp.]